jgi:uncharacterized protein (DUF433 family)
VYDVLSYLSCRSSIEEILEHFPLLTKDDVLASLAFAADAEKRFQRCTLYSGDVNSFI